MRGVQVVPGLGSSTAKTLLEAWQAKHVHALLQGKATIQQDRVPGLGRWALKVGGRPLPNPHPAGSHYLPEGQRPQ